MHVRYVCFILAQLYINITIANVPYLHINRICPNGHYMLYVII